MLSTMDTTCRKTIVRPSWAAFEWMYKKQLGRRNLTEEQKTYMIGKVYEARKNTESFKGNQYKSADAQNDHQQTRNEIKQGTAGQIGKEYGIGGATVRRAEEFSNGQNVHLKDRYEIKQGTAGQIGKAFGVDGKTVRRAEKFAKGVENVSSSSIV